jgi:uncharacterized protein YndB with AHSA1/START domain
MGDSSDGLKLEIKRVLPAVPTDAFAAFSDPGLLSQWWGPEGFAIPSLQFEPRAGARYRIEMQPPDGDAFHLSGEFNEVEPPARLVFTFVWEPANPDDVQTVADLAFRDVGDGTEVTLRQGLFRTEERLELHRGGWSDSFDKLERLLSGGKRSG